jgi:acetyl-CoA/propionyl-CoA carboxylase biotin carboxyl carrier protein
VRINAEDPAGGAFLPSPGPVTKLRVPQGFGVRWDGGYEAGDEVSQYYDNLVGKLVVWGADRPTAIARTIRALEEFEVEGIATTIPADLAVLRHPDFSAGEHSTKWVEERLDLSGTTAALAGATVADSDPVDPPEPKVRRDVDVEVNGRRFAVRVWVPESQVGAVAAPVAGAGRAAAPRARRSGSSGGGAAGTGEVTVPMQGTIVKVLVAEGDAVEVGQTVCVLEAMKMENNIAADRAGTVKDVKVEPGQSVGSGDVVVIIT